MSDPTPAPETAEYYRGAIAALEEIYNGPNVLRSAARVTVVAMMELYRLKLRALTPPAIAAARDPRKNPLAGDKTVSGGIFEMLVDCRSGDMVYVMNSRVGSTKAPYRTGVMLAEWHRYNKNAVVVATADDPAITAGDVAIAPDAEVAGPDVDYLSKIENCFHAIDNSSCVIGTESGDALINRLAKYGLRLVDQAKEAGR